MLKFLRKRTKAIVWVVVLAFTAWGGYAVSTQFVDANRSPGRIFGKEVSFRNYLLAHQAVQIFFPSPDPAHPPSADEIEARTWQFLILQREAKRRKIQVTDEEVRNEISRILGVKTGQNLDPEQYLRWIRSTFREEPREFEDQVREQLRIQKLLGEARSRFKENPDKQLKRWILALVRQAHTQVYKTQP